MSSNPENPISAHDPISMISDDDIIIANNNYKKERVAKFGAFGGVSGFAYPSDANPLVWIKLAAPSAEADMQIFAYNQLEALPQEARQNIRIPKVYRVMRNFDRFQHAIMVMEYVHGRTVESLARKPDPDAGPDLMEHIHTLAAKAISLFIDFPVPPNTTEPGPGGGCITLHPVFRDYEAPRVYRSVSDLQNSFNAHVADKCRGTGKPPQMDFLHERMCFCYSDIASRNFMYTDSEPRCLYVVDFQHASFLPISFMSYALLCHEAYNVRIRLGPKEGITDSGENLRLMGVYSNPFIRLRCD